MARAHHCACCITCSYCRASHSHTEYCNADPVPTAASTATSFFRCSSSFSHHSRSAGVGLWAALSDHQPALNRASILSSHWTGDSKRSIGSCKPEFHIPATPLQAGRQMNEHQYHRREQQREVYIRHQAAAVNMVPRSHWGSPGHCRGVYRPPGSEAVAATTAAGATNEAEDGEERLPPHELLAREWAEATSCGGAAFSVREGVGRTLKGRDLRRVRNTILKQTGFI